MGFDDDFFINIFGGRSHVGQTHRLTFFRLSSEKKILPVEKYRGIQCVCVCVGAFTIILRDPLGAEINQNSDFKVKQVTDD